MISPQIEYNNVNIVGWGGSGQTYLIRFFENVLKFKTNDISGFDGLKHGHFGILKKQKNRYVCIDYEKMKSSFNFYIYTHPVLMIQSHFRRRWQNLQCLRMTGVKQYMPNTLEEYMKIVTSENRDLFMLKSHYESWKNCPNFIPIEIGDISKYTKQLSHLLGVDVSLLQKIKIKPRNSVIDEKNENYNEFYVNIYNQIRNDANKILEKTLVCNS